jgi:urease accessory protein
MNEKSMSNGGWVAALGATAVLGAAGTAEAHVGVGPVHDLMHGLEHPLTGLDHLCAMIAVGIWAAQRGGRAIYLVPLSFVVVMMFGGALGMAAAKLPFVEPGIVLSLVVLGLLIAAAVRLPLAVSVLIVSLFALAHGFAHGAEVPADALGLTYAIGFTLATACLHAAGVAFGLSMQRWNSSQIVRLAGAAIAVCGLYLGIQ